MNAQSQLLCLCRPEQTRSWGRAARLLRCVTRGRRRRYVHAASPHAVRALTHVFNRRSLSCCRTARPSGASSRPRSTSWCWSCTEGTSWTPGQVRRRRRARRQLTNAGVFFFCPAGEQNSKQGDENTLKGVFETVMRVHYPAALGRIAVRTVPCPAVCADAFSLVSK